MLINIWKKRGFCDLNDFCGCNGRPQAFYRMPCSWHRKNRNYPVSPCPAGSGHRQIAGRVARSLPSRIHSLPWTGSKRFSSCLTSFDLMEGVYIFHRYFLRSGEKSATPGFLWTGTTFSRKKIFPCRYWLSCEMSYVFISHAQGNIVKWCRQACPLKQKRRIRDTPFILNGINHYSGGIFDGLAVQLHGHKCIMVAKWNIIIEVTCHLWQSHMIHFCDYMPDFNFYFLTSQIIYSWFCFFKTARLVHDGIVQSWSIAMQGNAKYHIGGGDFGNTFHEIQVGKRPSVCEDGNIRFRMLRHAVGQKLNELVLCQRRFATCQTNVWNISPLQEIQDFPCLAVCLVFETTGRLWAHQARHIAFTSQKKRRGCSSWGKKG